MTIGKNTRFVGLDLSKNTGLAILDVDGKVLESEELVAVRGKDDLTQMIDVRDRVRKHLNYSTDKIIIENFAFNARGQSVSYQFGVGYLIRAMLQDSGVKFIEPSPSQVKKFATNKGNAAKSAMILPVYKKWGFENASDNIVDAYVLARMGYSMYNHDGLTEYEKDVLKKIKKI